jgi:hypothetical protein
MDPAPRRGRRDNGLDAAAFVPLADVDPRVGEHLLDVLGAAGVPAYLEPSQDVDSYTRALALPSPPTDRLWVDREQRHAAGQIVAAEAQADALESAAAESATTARADRAAAERGPDDRPSIGLTDLEEEAIWRAIVESYETETATPVPPWPVQEDSEPGTGGADKDGEKKAKDQAPGGEADAPTIAVEPLAVEPEVVDEEEEHYVPPPPPPVPRLSRQALLALVLIVVGIGLMAVPGVIGMGYQDGITFGGCAVLAGGAVLVYRLRDSRDDDGPDDGAVV